MITAIKDKRLMKRILKRDMDALFEWFEIRKTKFYKIGWSYLKNHHDIEDCFQNTMLTVYNKIHQLKSDKVFEAWVTTIFINECRAIYRRKEKVNEQVHISKQVEEKQLNMLDFVDMLHKEQKEVIILKYLTGYSQQEISEILGLPVGTVKSRIYRGLQQLRTIMERGDRDEK